MYPLATRLNVRLAELLGVLSLGTDVGLGQPMEHALRQCVIALRLADRFEVDLQLRATIYYTALLMNVGGHCDGYERAQWFGDDIALLAARYGSRDSRGVRGAAATMRRVGSGQPAMSRMKVGAKYVVNGHRELEKAVAERVRVAADLARRLRLPDEVVEAICAGNERWDGKGAPFRMSGLSIPAATRFVQVAEFVEVAHRLGGTNEAVQLAQRHSGKHLDPRLCAALCADADFFLDGLDDKPTWQVVIDEQATLAIYLSATQFDEALHMIADLIDLKSPYTFGHSRAVARLAAAAGDLLGTDIDDVDQLYRAGLVHDLGRLGISNAIWHKRGILTTDERAEVRTYPALSARILAAAPALRELGELAGMHRERLDGSGYPMGLAGRRIPHDARVLAAADAYQSMREARPHRVAYTREEAAIRMRAEARAGRIDARAATAVLAAVATQERPHPINGAASLTAEEIDVLRLLVRGMRPREIARELMVTQRKVERRVRTVYAKTNTSGRVTASLYAMSHDLVLD
jgi:HD-GYP domain-containing protein (c-di-GMP phosphodiesterase class II)